MPLICHRQVAVNDDDIAVHEKSANCLAPQNDKRSTGDHIVQHCQMDGTEMALSLGILVAKTGLHLSMFNAEIYQTYVGC